MDSDEKIFPMKCLLCTIKTLYYCLLVSFLHCLVVFPLQSTAQGSVRCNNSQGENTNTSVCECDKGFFLRETACTMCREGEYKNTIGDTNTCTACEPGKYAAFQGQVRCVECPEGQICNRQGCTQCTPCPSNTREDSSHQNCLLIEPSVPRLCSEKHQRILGPTDRVADYKILPTLAS